MEETQISAADEAAPHGTPTLVSPAGVKIGYDIWGEGPPLVLIHGSFSDQITNWRHVKPLLAPHVTGYAMSRRGRGLTDRTEGHKLPDEIADAVALIETIGKPVHLLGHSYGAAVALGAAAAVPDLVRKLVVYEAPWPHIVDDETIDALAGLGASGDWQGFSMRFFSQVLSVPQAELDAAQHTEQWNQVLADAPASLGDLRALARHRFDPEDYRGLTMPVLLQTGSQSPPELYVTGALASVLPSAIIGVLSGQAHEGMTTAPQQYADAVRNFVAVRR
ncbi:alpha/beta hydrolase [uncultured Tateyamaria sp.]|uniref:alpha/beta fold hydrolase n=1 Tax=uncultured Tateyamaria sp. TaxID=455651 RepID=UPI00260DA6F6|nr:alpha/beta hydrolase [uncultured Tateyamaria sp.]